MLDWKALVIAAVRSQVLLRIFFCLFAVIMEAAARQSELPAGSSPARKSMRFSEEAVPIEGMPPWAEQMMIRLTKHTTNEISGLNIEVYEAKSMTMEAQQQFRTLKKELDEMKTFSAESSETTKADLKPAMKKIDHLEDQFKQMKMDASKGGVKGKLYAGKGRSDEGNGSWAPWAKGGKPKDDKHDEHFPFDHSQQDQTRVWRCLFGALMMRLGVKTSSKHWRNLGRHSIRRKRCFHF